MSAARSLNPQPEPHEDVTRSYQWRFRDPSFVTIWQRWQDARADWRKLRESTLPFHEGGPDAFYDPVPERITDEKHRAAAQEFQDARTAYHVEVGRRDQE